MLCQAFLSLLGCCLGQHQGYWYPGYSHLPTAAYSNPYQHYAGYSQAPAPAPAQLVSYTPAAVPASTASQFHAQDEFGKH